MKINNDEDELVDSVSAVDISKILDNNIYKSINDDIFNEKIKEYTKKYEGSISLEETPDCKYYINFDGKPEAIKFIKFINRCFFNDRRIEYNNFILDKYKSKGKLQNINEKYYINYDKFIKSICKIILHNKLNNFLFKKIKEVIGDEQFLNKHISLKDEVINNKINNFKIYHDFHKNYISYKETQFDIIRNINSIIQTEIEYNNNYILELLEFIHTNPNKKLDDFYKFLIKNINEIMSSLEILNEIIEKSITLNKEKYDDLFVKSKIPDLDGKIKKEYNNIYTVHDKVIDLCPKKPIKSKQARKQSKKQDEKQDEKDGE